MIGPELLYTMRLTSSTGASPFTKHTLEPGIGFWYAPFNAALSIGSAFQAKITIESGQNVSFALELPTMRAFYVFN